MKVKILHSVKLSWMRADRTQIFYQNFPSALLRRSSAAALPHVIRLAYVTLYRRDLTRFLPMPYGKGSTLNGQSGISGRTGAPELSGCGQIFQPPRSARDREECRIFNHEPFFTWIFSWSYAHYIWPGLNSGYPLYYSIPRRGSCYQYY